jgi:hypothetical protein
VVAWGENGYSGVTNVPFGLVDVVAISCGSGHTLALKANGTVVAWGGDAGAAAPPSNANFVAVATMGFWNIALRADGTTVEWGGAPYTDVPKPANLTNAVAIVSGYGYYEALRADGSLVGWGRGVDATNIPAGLSNVVAFASGDYHRVGLAPVNFPPQASDRSVSWGVNQPQTITLTAGTYDPNGDQLSFRITSLPTTGALYQYTPNGPGQAILAAGTAVLDPSRVIFVPGPGDFGNPYATFGVVANDGEFDAAPVTWTVAVVPAPIFQKAFFTNGPPPAFSIQFTGISNVSYTVWRSANLGNWVFLGHPTRLPSGDFNFADSTYTNSPVRFYRVTSP